jgi:hypothetical protein
MAITLVPTAIRYTPCLRLKMPLRTAHGRGYSRRT